MVTVAPEVTAATVTLQVTVVDSTPSLAVTVMFPEEPAAALVAVTSPVLVLIENPARAERE